MQEFKFLNKNELLNLWKGVNKNFGEIKRYEPIILDRKYGYLIWEFNIFNEITFVDINSLEYISMFASLNVNETNNCFNQLFETYSFKK